MHGVVFIYSSSSAESENPSTATISNEEKAESSAESKKSSSEDKDPAADQKEDQVEKKEKSPEREGGVSEETEEEKVVEKDEDSAEIKCDETTPLDNDGK